MPVERCQSDSRPGLRWGSRGKCFTYASGDEAGRSRARQQAINQGLAIGDIGTAAKALADILDDAEFWEQVKATMLAHVEPVFRESFLVGARLGADQRPRQGPADNPLAGVGMVEVVETLKAIRLGLKQDEITRLPFDFEAAVAASDEVIGAYSDNWWRQFQQSTQEGLRAAIQRADQAGLGVEAVIKDIEPLFGVERAARIAVSETTNLIGQGAQQTYRQAGFPSWTWRTVKDAFVDPICQDLNGQTFPISELFQRAHPNCRCVIPGQMALANGVRSAMTRRYKGSVITIETARGYHLTITPNHPIATPSGWLSAAEVHKGMHVFSDSIWNDRNSGRQIPDRVETPTLIENIVESLRQAPSMSSCTMPPATEDFHGDGGYGDVDVISTDRSLGIGSETKRADRFFEGSFRLIGPRAIFPRKSIEGTLALRSRYATDSIMRTGNLAIPLGTTHAIPARLRSSRTPSKSNTRFAQALRYCVTRDIETPSEFSNARAVLVGTAKSFDIDCPDVSLALDSALAQFPVKLGLRDASFVEDGMERLPSHITLDGVLSVRVGHYEGPVYNLETATGWYTVAGITVHNCFPVPAGRPQAATAALGVLGL